MSRLPSFALAVFLILSTLVGAQESEDAQLADLDRRIQEALVRGDVALLETHLDAEFTHTHSNQLRETKPEWLARAKEQQPVRYIARTVSEQIVERRGDVAMVIGRMDVRAQRANLPQQCYAMRFAHLYVRRDGRWRFLVHRTTDVLQERHDCK